MSEKKKVDVVRAWGITILLTFERGVERQVSGGHNGIIGQFFPVAVDNFDFHRNQGLLQHIHARRGPGRQFERQDFRVDDGIERIELKE